MAISKVYPFITPSNYTYSASCVDISGGSVSLNDVIAQYKADNNGICATKFDSKDLAWGNGVITGTLVSGATVSSNELDTSGFSGKSWYADAESNADSAQVGCIRVLVTPQYTGSPASNNFIFSANMNNGSLNNMIQIVHLTAGTVLLSVYNSAGSSIINSTLVSWSPTSGTEYEIELNYDITTGATRLFIDGTQAGSTQVATGTRTAAEVNRFALGTGSAGTEDNNNIYTGLVIFSTVQHTTDYTPTDWSEVPTTTYPCNSPTVTFDDTIRCEGVITFSETATKTGSDEIKYTLSKGSQEYYYSSGWVVSDGTYSQSNTATEINAALPFPSEDATVTIKMFLYSDDGSTTPTIDQVDITYDFHAPDSDTINKCIVYAYNVDGEGSPSTETITITPSGDALQYKDNVILQMTAITITPDADGYWEAELVETENMEDSPFYTFDFGNRSYKKTVPDQESAVFWDLEDK